MKNIYTPKVGEVYHANNSYAYFLVTTVDYNTKTFGIAYLGRFQGVAAPVCKFDILNKREYTLI